MKFPISAWWPVKEGPHESEMWVIKHATNTLVWPTIALKLRVLHKQRGRITSAKRTNGKGLDTVKDNVKEWRTRVSKI